MADIATPTTARKPEEFSSTQIKLVRDSLGISDDVYQPDRTYIIFNADAGNNNLHIITSGSLTYSITQGDGTQPVSYTDTGGTKVLNYITAGRYVITIDGTFNGISTSGEIAADKDKYIEIIGGSNYPTTIPANAFDTCENLRNVIFTSVTTIATEAFKDNAELRLAQFNSATSIQSDSFDGCDNLILLELPLDPTNSLVNLDNLNIAVDLDVDGESKLDNVSLGGDIIPETDNTHDFGSTLKKIKDFFIAGVSYLKTISLGGSIIPELADTYSLGSSTMAMKHVYTNSITFDGSNTWVIEEIEIGDWDMYAATGTGSITVAHGLSDHQKIRAVNVIIRKDGDTTTYPIEYVSSGGVSTGGVSEIDATNITLTRVTGGFFDSTFFDDTSYNRGWVTITYV